MDLTIIINEVKQFTLKIIRQPIRLSVEVSVLQAEIVLDSVDVVAGRIEAGIQTGFECFSGIASGHSKAVLHEAVPVIVNGEGIRIAGNGCGDADVEIHDICDSEDLGPARDLVRDDREGYVCAPVVNIDPDVDTVGADHVGDEFASGYGGDVLDSDKIGAFVDEGLILLELVPAVLDDFADDRIHSGIQSGGFVCHDGFIDTLTFNSIVHRFVTG